VGQTGVGGGSPERPAARSVQRTTGACWTQYPLDVTSLDSPTLIRLRPPTHADIPGMFAMQLDPEGNRLAGTKPRTLEAFTAIWNKILGDAESPPDPAVVPRAIVRGGVLVGMINIFPREGRDYVGYWIERAHWGGGVATRALGLMLAESPRRPLFAQVAVHNTASLRVLERHGFVITERKHEAETDRFVAGEVVTLRLG
jgi:RimJ/RimL family protein N-acetyltransferase